MLDNNFSLVKEIHISSNFGRENRNFSARVISGEVSAPGFTLFEDLNQDTFDSITWSLNLKLVNSSNESLVIETIEAEIKGEDGLISKSQPKAVMIYEIQNKSENINKLPILIKANSEKIIRAEFILFLFKKMLLQKPKVIVLKRSDIKEPEIYEKLLKTATIIINGHKKVKVY